MTQNMVFRLSYLGAALSLFVRVCCLHVVDDGVCVLCFLLSCDCLGLVLAMLSWHNVEVAGTHNAWMAESTAGAYSSSVSLMMLEK